MAETKILNLDELLPEKQFVVLDGKTHEMLPATTQMYLEVLQKRQRMKGAPTEADQADMMLDLLANALPTVGKDRLKQLPMKLLTQLSRIIEKQMADTSDDGEGGDDSGE